MRLATLRDGVTTMCSIAPVLLHSNDCSTLGGGCPGPSTLAEGILAASGAVGCCLMVDRCRSSAVGMTTQVAGSARLEIGLRVLSCSVLAAGGTTEPGSPVRHVLRVEGARYDLIALRIAEPGMPRAASLALVFDAACQPGNTTPEACLERVMPLARTALALLMASANQEGDMRRLERRCSTLQEALQTDPVTGLLTPDAFRTEAAALHGAGDGPVALVLMDVFHGKNVVALYDRRFVDTYLESVAASLSALVPARARLARMSDGEFALLCGLDASLALSELTGRCRSAVNHAARTLGRPGLADVVMGTAVQEDRSEGLPALIDQGRAALRVARARGAPSQVAWGTEKAGRLGPGEIDRLFRRAVDLGRIKPYFHPIVDLRTGRCRGFEVLARWIAEDGTLLLPGDFDEAFRDCRTAEALTRLMLAEGLAHFAAWCRRAGPEAAKARISVNLTGYDLTNPDLPAVVSDLLKVQGVPARALTLEVTETVVLGDPRSQAHRVLEALRADGVRVAMDDFGTGYGSLTHLRDWPIDTLKIDRGFVRHLTESVQDCAVVEAILGLAARCGMSVVIEGIESADQIKVLRQMTGLQPDALAQGYFFSEPLAPDDMTQARLRYPVPTARKGTSAPDDRNRCLI